MENALHALEAIKVSWFGNRWWLQIVHVAALAYNQFQEFSIWQMQSKSSALILPSNFYLGTKMTDSSEPMWDFVHLWQKFAPPREFRNTEGACVK